MEIVFKEEGIVNVDIVFWVEFFYFIGDGFSEQIFFLEIERVFVGILKDYKFYLLR